MEEDEDVNPNKRLRVTDSLNELQQIIKLKDRAIEKLSAENNELKRKVDELVKTIHGSFFLKNPTDEEQESVCQKEEAMRKRKLRKKKMSPASKGVSQAKAEAGIPTEVEEGGDSDITTDLSSMDIECSPVSKKNAVGSKPKVLGPDLAQHQKDAHGEDHRKNINSKKVPILTTYNINVREISDKIGLRLGHKDFNIRIMGKHVTNIGVCTLGDYEEVKNLLREERVDFYTFTPRGQRPVSIVVKGLSGSFEEKEVLEYMGSLQANIRILGLTKLRGDKWLFRMDRESDIRSFKNIRYILHCRVQMGKFSRKGLIQCFNCQRFGHVATNCGMPYRCVKCGGGHGPGKCEIPSRDEDTTEILTTDPKTGQATRKIGHPVKCVNCEMVGHVASSRECPKRRELLRRMESKKDAGNENPVPPRMARTVRGISYAAAVRAATVDNGVMNTSGVKGITLAAAREEFSLIDGDCRRLLGGGLLGCLGRLRGFAKEYRSLKNDDERSRALLGMLISLHHDG